jgi:hypothetical protein
VVLSTYQYNNNPIERCGIAELHWDGTLFNSAMVIMAINALYFQYQRRIMMRKITINPPTENTLSSEVNFLDLDHLAQVEISSECEEHPIESALVADSESESGWQAACSGEQSIRLVFDQPQTIKYIYLRFDEQEHSRTQEFVLLWRMDNEDSFREILRQQYHFSPPLTTRENEEYTVDLKQLKVLELKIIPDISGGGACAKLTRLRLAAN